MKEAGKVIDLKGEFAIVELARSKACKSCGVCYMAADQKKMLTEALNLAHAGIGDCVYLELESKNILIASLVVYVLPLVFLILGYLVGAFFTSIFFGQQFAEAGGIGLGFVCLAFSYFIIKLVDKRISKITKFQPIITKVVEDNK
jgi:sigma-E factor negative regulatory protein RseC